MVTVLQEERVAIHRYLQTSICSFVRSFVHSAVNYFGLVDQYAATQDDYLTVNSDFVYSMLGLKHTFSLADGLFMPLCNSYLEASADNADGACPNDGSYRFESVYSMPDSESVFVGWAASGWKGVVTVEAYLVRTNELVGKCSMDVTTMVSGSFENGIFKTVPSAATITYGVLTLLVASLALCMCCRTCATQRRRRQRRKEPLLDTTTTTTPKDPTGTDPPMEYDPTAPTSVYQPPDTQRPARDQWYLL